MPSRTPKQQQQHLQNHCHQYPLIVKPTSRMLYESVDNYHSMGFMDNSVRLNNPRDLNDFSSQSIVCAMDRFVKAVNNMNETIMVPCRLLDMEVVAQKPSSKVPKLLKNGGDPYSYYSLLNSVKNDLILGASSNDEDTTTTDRTPMMLPSINSTRWTDEGETRDEAKKEALRRQSTMSLASDSSSNTSEMDSVAETCSESAEDDDRSSEGEENTLVANNVTQALHSHLVGLHACLKNLTDTATYITDCYKESVNL
ncbi:mid1-interacting protein 1A-like [Macrobrachium nipponense]|uniref:mid1-interacting protein 1A-like n=1 Tax=Macrobrachium nipponense TaxID=159736 RepID=UPI0030C7EDFF